MQTKNETVEWSVLTDELLIGGVIEIFRDCSFEDILHEYIRGIVTKVERRDGKPSAILFKDTRVCLQSESGIQPWEEKPEWFRVECQEDLYNLSLHPDAMKSLWIEKNAFVFLTLNENHIALYQKGVTPPEAPHFADSVAGSKALVKFVLGESK